MVQRLLSFACRQVAIVNGRVSLSKARLSKPSSLTAFPSLIQDEEQNPPAKIVELKKRIREADAVLFVTPEYNYSIPGVLKNAIDPAWRPYGDSAGNGKPAAITGVSTGAIGTARAQYHLRQIVVLMGAKARSNRIRRWNKDYSCLRDASGATRNSIVNDRPC